MQNENATVVAGLFKLAKAYRREANECRERLNEIYKDVLRDGCPRPWEVSALNAKLNTAQSKADFMHCAAKLAKQGMKQ